LLKDWFCICFPSLFLICINGYKHLNQSLMVYFFYFCLVTLFFWCKIKWQFIYMVYFFYFFLVTLFFWCKIKWQFIHFFLSSFPDLYNILPFFELTINVQKFSSVMSGFSKMCITRTMDSYTQVSVSLVPMLENYSLILIDKCIFSLLFLHDVMVISDFIQCVW
jgi:hypothetical protein